MKYKLILTTLSDTLIGSAQSFGNIIDTDIVFDEMGLPYIPAKRIKGLFCNAASDLLEAGAYDCLTGLERINLDELFGGQGDTRGEPCIIFDNMQLAGGEDLEAWLSYMNDNYEYGFNQMQVVEHFTTLRSQTAMERQHRLAKEHSLRTSRVLKRGLNFEGNLSVLNCKEQSRNLLAACCLYIDRIGTNRNRGFGKIRLELIDEQGKSVTNELRKSLEETCMR